MQKKLVPILLIIILVAALAILGNRFIKPSYEDVRKNPYALRLDTVGIVPEDQFCGVNATQIKLPLNTLKALAVDAEGQIIISGDSSILVFSANAQLLSKIPTAITATAITTFGNNSIYAALENRIIVIDRQTEEVSYWENSHPEAYITSLATNGQSLFIADADASMVYEYTLNGGFIRAIGNKTQKDSPDCFILPSYYFDLAIAPDRSLWVVNPGKHQLVNFNQEGILQSFWGETSSAPHGFSGCCNPSHIAILSDGSFITAEKGLVRVKKYSPEGNFECVVASPDHFMTGAIGLDIAVDSKDNILVLEPGAKTLHIFNLTD